MTWVSTDKFIGNSSQVQLIYLITAQTVQRVGHNRHIPGESLAMPPFTFCERTSQLGDFFWINLVISSIVSSVSRRTGLLKNMSTTVVYNTPGSFARKVFATPVLILPSHWHHGSSNHDNSQAVMIYIASTDYLLLCV